MEPSYISEGSAGRIKSCFVNMHFVFGNRLSLASTIIQSCHSLQNIYIFEIYGFWGHEDTASIRGKIFQSNANILLDQPHINSSRLRSPQLQVILFESDLARAYCSAALLVVVAYQ